MASIELSLVIDPRPKNNPAVSRTGITYTRKKCKDYRNAIKDMASKELSNIMPLDGALFCKIIFFLKKPKSAKKRKHPFVRPDIDNFIKNLLDPLSGIMYKDDSQIVHIDCKKEYADSGGIYIKVTELE